MTDRRGLGVAVHELAALWTRNHDATDELTRVLAEYIAVVGTRRV